MADINSLFVTRLYHAALSETDKAPDLAELREENFSNFSSPRLT